MRFLDSSTILYAYIKPRKEPTPEVARLKAKAQETIRRIQGGERVATTVIHVSEIANILEARMPRGDARAVVLSILNSSNVDVVAVDEGTYLNAVQVAERHDVGLNDAVAYGCMLESGVSEVYSLDSDFDKLPGIQRI